MTTRVSNQIDFSDFFIPIYIALIASPCVFITLAPSLPLPPSANLNLLPLTYLSLIPFSSFIFSSTRLSLEVYRWW